MLQFLKIGFLFITSFTLVNCNGQTPNNKTATLSNDLDNSPPFYYKMPKKLTAIDTSPGFKQNGQKIMLTGTVFKNDGKTPAPNTILYYYQTNTEGLYVTKESEKRNMPKNKLGHTHGYIRGWLKTDQLGKYQIFTIKPGTYPSRNEPAHIHITVKENNMEDIYYIDDFVFDMDPLLTTKRRKAKENRGGSGIIRFVESDNIWVGERDIILGLNIPNYPEEDTKRQSSGKNISEDILSFTPFHAFGADKGSKTCPICKYGWYHGILYFVGNEPNWEDIKKWLVFFDNESAKREKYLKVYFVYGNESNYNKNQRTHQLDQLGSDLNLKNIALTFVPSFSDISSEIYLNKINPNVQNTILIYKRSKIIDKFIDLQPNKENFSIISNRLDKSSNKYFNLSRAKQN